MFVSGPVKTGKSDTVLEDFRLRVLVSSDQVCNLLKGGHLDVRELINAGQGKTYMYSRQFGVCVCE